MCILGWLLLVGGLLLCVSILWAAPGFFCMGLGLIFLQIAERKRRRAESAASPSDPPYVSVGDNINVEQTLCQVEAMKMFTSISLESFNGADIVYSPDRNYQVVRVNQANGAQVNAGDLLFVVKPV